MGEPLRWTRGRFPHWFSADARGESSPLNRGERDELNALPYARYWWNEPIVPRRAWSAGVYNDVPQLWKWDAAGQVPPATLRDQYAGETRPESEASVRPAKPQPEPASKITLNVPILRRALPGVSAVRVVDIPNTAGRTDRSLIVDTDRGTLWLRWLGNDGYGQTRWITSQERKQLEARSKPDVYAVSAPIPETVPPITGATAPNTPSDLRPLCLWSDGSGYHAAVGSPFPWYDDRSKKQWTQKAAFPASVQRYLRTASDLQKMPVSRMGQYFVVGSDAGLWTHSDGDSEGKWFPVTLPQTFEPAQNGATGTLTGRDIHLGRVAPDRQSVFIAGRGDKPNDPPVLLRFNKTTGATALLAEGTSGIPSLRGGTPLLISDGDTVWCAPQPLADNPDTERGDIAGGYRWNVATNRFVRVTDEPMVALQTDTAGRDVFLLAPTGLLRWSRATGKTTRFALPPKTQAQVMTQSPSTVYVAVPGAVYAWSKTTKQWRHVADTPRLGNRARLTIAPAPHPAALWLHDDSTTVRIALPAR